MVVQEEEIENRGKLRNSSVVLSNNQQSGYMVSIEAFHQVHCLVRHILNCPFLRIIGKLTYNSWQDLLRKYSYIDYYKAKEPDLFNNPNFRTHVGMPCYVFF